MQKVQGDPPGSERRFAEKVQGEPSDDMSLGADPIDRFLHFAIASVAAFHGIQSGAQKPIIQESQGLLHAAGEQRFQHLAQGREPLHPLAELRQIRKRHFCPPAPIKRWVDFVRNLTEGS